MNGDLKNYFVHETSIVDNGAQIGEGTKIWHFSHICSGAIIGKNCSFGQNVYVAPGVVIGDNVRVQNGVSIYSGLVIDDYCFLGPHCTFTNDKYPRSCGNWTLEKTHLKKGSSVGANATILCGIELGEYSMVGCGSVVIRTVPPKTLVVGNPARIVKVFTYKEIKDKFDFYNCE
jgi:UDP-2-acetamido-3-amino-2,3-dideoxy-glucuronate N-acetyltransferase